jgi:hypothetical protein
VQRGPALFAPTFSAAVETQQPLLQLRYNWSVFPPKPAAIAWYSVKQGERPGTCAEASGSCAATMGSAVGKSPELFSWRTYTPGAATFSRVLEK